MTVDYKICVDCADPHRLAAFWANAMGYEIEDHSTLVDSLLKAGHVGEAEVETVDGRSRFRAAAGIRAPEDPVDPFSGMGQGRRMLFQIVPEPKTAKNRMHLDLHVGAEKRDSVVKGLVDAGGTVIGEGSQGQSSWIVMADPEGNEFCVA